MKHAKHTPGPWNWTYNSHKKTPKSFEVYDSNERIGDAWRGIAKLPDHRGAKENRANALLIAAAPDLLEALELAVRRIEDSAEATAYFGIELGQLQEAIAKARGES